ncbi:MAG: putative LPS assembly protein LptD [Cyclobacteriaceae bacterium]
MLYVFAIPLPKIVNFSLKPKDLTINSGLVRHSFIFIIVFLLVAVSTVAQVENPIKNPAGTLPVRQDTTQVLPDTIPNTSDSLNIQNDSIPRAKGDIETTINYTARDSIRASIDGKLIWLYGNAKITYGSIELEAEEITIDYGKSTMTAHGVRDSLGNRVGFPVFKNGAELYETKDIVYNFKTGRARISEVVTKQDESILHGETVFKNENNELLSLHNTFTTCNLEHPHFSIRSTKTKAIPNDKIVSGPFYVVFNDIPLPAGFLFGMFPAQRESKSGIIGPSYGEERRRGFNFRNGGYFFDISEYIKLSLTGDLYSKGGHAIYANSTYMKRYAYNGNFNFSYSKNRLGQNIEDSDVSNDFRLMWSHSPQSKGTGRFAASVNAATATFNQNNNLMYGTANELASNSISNISTKLSSNVSYSKRFAGTPFSMGINLSHSQDLQTRLVDLPLPNVSLNMTNLYPFQRKGKTSFLDNFSLGYSMTGTNRITNNLGRLTPESPRDSIAPFTFDNLPLFLKNGRKGVRHSIPLSYSFKALKFFTLSPSVNYEEKWYFEKLNWKYVQDEKTGNYSAKADTIPGFNRVANYSLSIGVNTRVYGMYFFKSGKVKAIRHVINPSISLGLTPDFSKNPEYFNIINRPVGPGLPYEPTVEYKARHEGFVYGPSGLGKAGSVSFGIGNNLEMKVKGEKDTVERKVMLLNNLSLSSSYNLMADSFKLSTIGLSANTNILDNTININLSASLDPYNYVRTSDGEGKITERRVDAYAWKGGGIGRITTATLALNTNLNPSMRKKENETREKVVKSDIPEEDKQHIIENPNSYIDFDIPWSLNLGYNLNYRRPITRNADKIQPAEVIQTLQVSGDLSVSEKWKITYNTGYHFESKEFTQTNVGISRDLHCWQMNLTWVPFGRFQSYNFTIAVKASVLQDLKLERRRPFLDNL